MKPPSTESGLPARRAALRILERVSEGEPFDLARDSAVGALPDRDRRLAHELSAGVLRRQTALDQALGPLVPNGLRLVDPRVRSILRLGAYQIRALDRVPRHAAVSTSVTLAKESAGPKAAGFVNAVLRRFAALEAVPAEVNGLGAGPPNTPAQLAVRYSHPLWLVNRWFAGFGAEETEALLEWNNTAPSLVVQPARASVESIGDRWRVAGLTVSSAPYGAGLVIRGMKPAALPGFDTGDFMVQDPAHALVVRYAQLPAGATVYDACAAPGGKTIALGRTAGIVIAGEIARLRATRLRENLARAGSGREYVVLADAGRPPLRPVDAVLLDAPCLGTGTFARHPDARWRVRADALRSLARRQRKLLEQLAAVVRPGGLLIYATCSLEPEENAQQVQSFLRTHPDFSRDPGGDFPQELLSPEGDLRILPQRQRMDGAYASRLRKAG